MDYEFRNRSGSGPYAAASSLYPRVGQPSPAAATAPPPPTRMAPYHHSSSSAGAPPPASSSLTPTSVGIRVVIKPEYQITPPPQLAPQMMEVPRSTFKFDFEYERRILAEAEKENPNWSKFVVESQPPPPRHAAPPTSMASTGDPVVDKYIAMGLGREAVSFAVLNYGDNPAKVKEFVNSYNILHEMGFTSKNVPELLAIHDNDPDKVIQHLLNTS